MKKKKAKVIDVPIPEWARKMAARIRSRTNLQVADLREELTLNFDHWGKQIDRILQTKFKLVDKYAARLEIADALIGEFDARINMQAGKLEEFNRRLNAMSDQTVRPVFGLTKEQKKDLLDPNKSVAGRCIPLSDGTLTLSGELAKINEVLDEDTPTEPIKDRDDLTMTGSEAVISRQK